MRAITSGETLNKNDVYSKEAISSFLKNQKEIINGFLNNKCIYTDKSFISDAVTNYLNFLPVTKTDTIIKNLILSEYYRCENVYPYLGDYFIARFFEIIKKPSKRKSFLFQNKHEKELISSVTNNNVKNIAKWLIDNINLEYNIIVEESEEKDFYIDVIDDFIFDFEYDYDFYKNNPGLCVKDYNFIIIDGFLESVSEIHHLMFKANESKEPYVIFCHGLSEEVKYNILKNNKEGRTQVLPVSINYNENTLNVLNDLAVVHNDSIVSSKLGQTISQEIRRSLKKGKSITFLKNSLLLKSSASYIDILTHRNFLKKRIENANRKMDVNTDVLYDRLKSFSLKSVKLYVPKDLKRNKDFTRELDYVLRLFSNLSQNMMTCRLLSKKNYLVPINVIKNAEKRVNSLQEILYNIENIII
jgi:hypothetical protein